MAMAVSGYYSLVHADDLGCICPGCAAMAPVDPADAGGPGEGRRPVPDDVLDRLLGLDRGGPDWAPVLSGSDPERAEQQATSSSFPYDIVTNDADQGVDGLMSGRIWDQTALTYSFPTSAADYETNYANAVALSTLSGFTETQKAVTRDALAQYAAISGLTFTEIGDDPGEQAIDGDLRFANSDDPGTAYAYYPSDNPVGGDSMYSTGSYLSPRIGNYQYHTFLHEIGHALGLKHGHETNGPGAVPYDLDSMEFTVMTYRSWVGKPLTYGYANESWGYSQSLMMLDIAAVQRMYGANFATNAGNTTYTFSTTTGEMFVDGVGQGTPGGNRIFRTIWDGDGVDTYDFSTHTTALAVDLMPGSYVDLDVGGTFQRAKLDFGYQGNPVTYARGHVFNALQHEGDARSLIENARGGSGSDVFRGNAADNRFEGNGGNDRFFDSAGSDTYLGGDGADEVVFDGLFTSYAFALGASFLQVIGSVVDWVEDTVETLVFSDVSRTWVEIAQGLTSNTPPVAADDAYTVGEDVVLSGVNVLGNDSDADGNALTVGAVNGLAGNVGATVALASGALVTVNADGSVTYDQNGAFDTLALGETAADSFTYDATDGFDSATATVTITIEGAFDTAPPVAVDDTASVDEDVVLAAIAVLANDSDPDLDPIGVTAIDGTAVAAGESVTIASGAVVTLNADGTLAYDQSGAFDALDAGETGTDSFAYTISDGQKTASASVTVTIAGAFDNQAPVAVDDSFTGREMSEITGAVLANDTDADGGTLRVTALDGAAAAIGTTVALASGALITLNADGTFVYDPNGAFAALEDGETATDGFGYTIEDGQGGSAAASVTLTIDGVSPIVVAEPLTIGFETAALGAYAGEAGLAFFGLDVVGGAILSGQQAGSTLADGGFTIMATGEDFDLDGLAMITPVGRVRVQFVAFDDGVEVGSVNLNLRGGRVVERTFDATFDSVDRVEVLATGEVFIDDLALVTRRLEDPGENRAPVAADDAFSAAEGALVTGNLLADNGAGADSDPDGDALAVVSVAGDLTGSVTLGSGAIVTFAPDGGFTYDQNGAFDGLFEGESATDSFVYVIEDGRGGSDSGVATVTIAGSGTPPPEPVTVVLGFEGTAEEAAFQFTDTGTTTQSPGVSSGSLAGISQGNAMSFASLDGSEFDFQSGVFTALSGKNVTLSVTGWRDGIEVAAEDVRIRDNRETGITLTDPGFDAVDRVVFTATGGLIADDLTLLV